MTRARARNGGAPQQKPKPPPADEAAPAVPALAGWWDWLEPHLPQPAALCAFAAQADVAPVLANCLFDCEGYAAARGVPAPDALAHYKQHGGPAGADPNPWFSEAWYRTAYPDVARGIAAGAWHCGYHHYLAAGMAEHRSANGLVNELMLLGTRPLLLAEVRSGAAPCALLRVLCRGDAPSEPPPPLPPLLDLPVPRPADPGPPSPLFAEAAYLDAYTDVPRDGSAHPGQEHWRRFGLAEDTAGTRPRLPAYVEATYLRHNPDVSAQVDRGALPSGYHHYLAFGQAEGRAGGPALWAQAEWWHLDQALHTATPVPPSPDLPTISVIVPVFNTDPALLRACIDSVFAQSYPAWELCLGDDGSHEPATLEVLAQAARRDPRVRLGILPQHGGISAATNRAIALSSGSILAMLDHDDVLMPDALRHVADAFGSAGDVDLVYSDEAKLDERGRPFGLNAKPGWSPEMLLSTMYLGHLVAYRRSLVDSLGGLRSPLDGTQDYDLALRAAEQVRRVVHIPRPLYLWRLSATSTAKSLAHKPGVVQLQRRALEAALLRRGLAGTVQPGHGPGHWSVLLDVPDPPPLVSIVIPTAGRSMTLRPPGGAPETVDLVANLLHSLQATALYPNLEYVVVHNGDLRAETLAALAALAPVRLVEYRAARFNLSQKINQGVAAAAGEFVLLLNDDMQAASAGFVRSMLGRMHPGVGAVGGRLLYADGTLQHAGVIWVGDGPTHAMIGEHPLTGGPGERLRMVHDCLAVSGACLLARRAAFLAAGGFPESLPMNYNDVALCLSLRDAGLRIVFDPEVTFYHFEAQTKSGTYVWELQRLLLAHPDVTDPYFNPHFRGSSPFYELTGPGEPDAPSYLAWMLDRIRRRRTRWPAGAGVRFSIILGVHDNRRDQMEQLEATVLGQTYPDWEWVIADDGSTRAETLAWLDAVRQHPRVTLITLPRNGGIMASYGAAFRAASGDYVVPVDADDFLTLDCLQVLAHAIEQADRPEAVYSDEDKASEAGSIHSPFLKPDWDPVLFTNICYACHVCAIRRDAAAAAGCYQDPAATWCHDWDTLWRLARAGGRIVHVPEVLYSWRIHPGSTASVETGGKPGTLASQKHVLDRHLALTGLDQAFDIVPNTLFPHPGIWRLRPRPGAVPPVAVLLMAQGALDPGGSLLADLGHGLRPQDRLVLVGADAAFGQSLDTVPPELRAPLDRGGTADRLDTALAGLDGFGIAAVVGAGLGGLSEGWVQEGAGLFAAAPDVAAVGGHLARPDGRAAWRGGFLDFGALAGAPEYGLAADDSGYYGLSWCQRSCDAVPAPLFFCRPDLLAEAASVLPPEQAGLAGLAGALTGLVVQRGLRVVSTPFLHAPLLHAASVEPSALALRTAPAPSRYYPRDVGRTLATAYRLTDAKADGPWSARQ